MSVQHVLATIVVCANSLWAGLEGLIELCRELQVWSQPDVILANVRPAISVSRRERNLHVLKSCGAVNLVDFQSVNSSTAFMHDPDIMNELELKLMSEFPTGDYVLFPFEPADGSPGS